MSDRLEEIIALHDAATACGCSCCDEDYCAYVERQNHQRLREQSETRPDSAAEVRKSVRFQFEGSPGW